MPARPGSPERRVDPKPFGLARQAAELRFYAGLNDFLEPRYRQQDIRYLFKGQPSIKHVLEALGVPHPEVDLILVNGASVDFSYPLQNGDRVSVYPMFQSLEVGAVSRVRPAPLPEARFVLDNHLGRLAAYLRMLGFDTLYRNDIGDPALARLSDQEGRILLTRDRGLLMRNQVTYGYWIRSKDPRQQAIEVMERFNLRPQVRPFRHCLRCNGLLTPVSKEQIVEQLEPKTRRYYDRFYRCQSCGQVYWRGSHYERMQRFIDALLGEAEEHPPGALRPGPCKAADG